MVSKMAAILKAKFSLKSKSQR